MTDLAINWLAAIFRASWHGSLALAAVWFTIRFLPALSPKAKMQLLRLTYTCFLAELLIPAITVSILPASQTSVSQIMDAGGGTLQYIQRYMGPISIALLAVWLLCAARLMVKTGYAMALTIKASRRWTPLTDEHGRRHIHWTCRRICMRLGMARIPRISTSEDGGPALVGFIRPVVMLPTGAINTCSQRELELVLAHELAHLRKGDLIWSTLAALADALFFFIPPLKWASNELRIVQEMDADATAISITESEPSEYGALLVRLSVGDKKPLGELLTAAMSSFEFLKLRLLHLTTGHKTGLLPAAVSLVLCICLGLTALPVRFAAKSDPIAFIGLPSPGKDTFVYSYSDGSGKRLFLRANTLTSPPVNTPLKKKVVLRLPAAGGEKHLFLVGKNVAYKAVD